MPTEAPDPTAAAVLGPTGGDQPGPNGQLYSKHAAQLRLESDLATLQLPKGAVRQTGPIPAVIDRGSGGIGATVAALDTWWTVPGQREDVKAFIARQHPDGMSYLGGGGDNEGEVTLDFEYPQHAKDPFTFFEVGIAQDRDHTDVRLQLQVAYVPTRTAIETIPGSVSSGTGVYQPPTRVPSNFTPAPRRSSTLSAADVRVIADALNGLDAQATGIEHSCPPPNGEEAWFRFAYGDHTVVFHVMLNGCGGVFVTADGVPQPELSLGEAIFNGVEKSLHVTKRENPNLSVAP